MEDWLILAVKIESPVANWIQLDFAELIGFVSALSDMFSFGHKFDRVFEDRSYKGFVFHFFAPPDMLRRKQYLSVWKHRTNQTLAKLRILEWNDVYKRLNARGLVYVRYV